MSKLESPTLRVVVTVALAVAIPHLAAASAGTFVGGAVNIAGGEWGKIAMITSATPIAKFTLSGGTITGAGLSARVDVILVTAGANLNNYRGPLCHAAATVATGLPIINGSCNPPLPAGSYDAYMLYKGTAAFGTVTYNFNDSSNLCVSPPAEDGSEGSGDATFRNPATTTAVVGGSGTIFPGSVFTLQVLVAHCKRVVVTELVLYAVPTAAPDTFTLVADEMLSSVETVNFQRRARATFQTCDSVSLPVGHGVNQPGGRFTLGVTADCFFSQTVDLPRSFAVQKSAAVWLDAGFDQPPNVAVGTFVNGGLEACPNGRGR